MLPRPGSRARLPSCPCASLPRCCRGPALARGGLASASPAPPDGLQTARERAACCTQTPSWSPAPWPPGARAAELPTHACACPRARGVWHVCVCAHV